MHLDHCHLASVLIGVLVERDRAWFVRLDEGRKLRNTPLLVLELALLELVSSDEDERPGHFGSLRLGFDGLSAVRRSRRHPFDVDGRGPGSGLARSVGQASARLMYLMA